MKYTVIVPAIAEFGGDDRSVGVVVEWRKQIGEMVQAGEALALVGQAEILSPVFGVLHKKMALPGEAIEIGEPLAVLSGVPLNLVSGRESLPEVLSSVVGYAPQGSEETIRLSPVQGAVARHAARSAQVSPHVFTGESVDITEAIPLLPRLGGSLLPLVVTATATALRRFPALNTQWISPQEIRRKQYVHIAVPMRTADGTLIVPVLRDADRKSPLGIARELEEVRQQTLSASQQRGATFTVRETSAAWQSSILHQPQAAQLCFGAARRQPVLLGDSVGVGWVIQLCLAHDARLVTEEEAVAFLGAVKASLEEAQFLFAG